MKKDFISYEEYLAMHEKCERMEREKFFDFLRPVGNLIKELFRVTFKRIFFNG